MLARPNRCRSLLWKTYFFGFVAQKMNWACRILFLDARGCEYALSYCSRSSLVGFAGLLVAYLDEEPSDPV